MDHPTNNPFEDSLIDQLDDKRLADLYLPLIKQVLKAGGGADAILKKSEALAALKLSTSAMSEKPDIALKAAIEILNRVQGKPVERHLNIYADVAAMSEQQLDREIYALAKRAGVQEVIDVIALEAKPLPPKKKRQTLNQKIVVTSPDNLKPRV